jgi:hypothetical protein
VEHDVRGAIHPVLYLRRGGVVSEHALPPHPLHEYTSADHRREAADRVAVLLRSSPET